MIRLIHKWLKAGVAEDGRVTPGEVGTPQGAVIPPLLANIYLHYVFGLWAANGGNATPMATSSWCATPTTSSCR